jgi:hypothetical protein
MNVKSESTFIHVPDRQFHFANLEGPGKERRLLERLFPIDRLTTINSITEEVMKRVFQLTPKP